MTAERPFPQDLQERERKLLDQMKKYPGFPFVVGKEFSSLDQIMMRFQETALTNISQVTEGTQLLKDMPRSVVYITGLPGKGKTTLARGIVKEYAEVVAEKCKEKGIEMEVMVAEFDEYDEKYCSENNIVIDRSKPHPLWLLKEIGEYMDQAIAAKLRESPNTILIIDRPGGTQIPLLSQFGNGRLIEWVARSYGATGENIIKGDPPFTDIPLHLTRIGVIGGPYTIDGVRQRDEIKASNMELHEINEIRKIQGLPSLSEEELGWNMRGAPKATVEKVAIKQRALVFYMLSQKGGVFGAHIPAFVMDIIREVNIREIPVIVREYVDDPKVYELWSELREVAEKQTGLERNPVLLLWRICWDFAGAEILPFTLGLDGTIIYSNKLTSNTESSS